MLLEKQSFVWVFSTGKSCMAYRKRGGCIKSTYSKPKQCLIACCLWHRGNKLFVLVNRRNSSCLQFNIYLARLLWLTMWVFKAQRIKVCMPNYLRTNFALNIIFQTY